MNIPANNPAIRQGQFLWMDERTKREYLSILKQRISDGYYFSERVISRIVDELAPVINETVERDA
jgi:hypothetical protein